MHDNLVMNDQKKYAIITGGNKGIGLEITKYLIKNNYGVVVGGRSKIHLNFNSDKLIFVQGDVSDPGFHDLLVKTCIQQNKRIDLYINNAGFSEWRPIENISQSFLKKIFDVNLFGAFWGCKAAIPFLKKGSSIINISSIAGKRGSTNNSAYVATKFGMNGLTQSLAKEIGLKGIRVNAICPVLIKTDGLMKALDSKSSPAFPDPDQFLSKFENSQSALGRLPYAEEVAKMVLFLASSSASAITGQCINVDCGVFPQ